MTTIKRHFVYQADYQHWANDALFIAVDHLDEAARHAPQGLYFENIHMAVNHILVVARNWMARFRGEQPSGSEAVFCPDWKELKNALRHEFRDMQRWLEAQPESFFEAEIAYSGPDHQPHHIWVRDALNHVMTHAAHQRGLVAAVAMRLGAPIPEMDYLRYKHEMEQHLQRIGMP